MKKVLLLVVMLFAIRIVSFAQFSAVAYKDNGFTQFMTTTTYFTLTGDERFDNAMISALKDYWDITPYEILKDEPDFIAKKNQKSASFIALVDITNSKGQTYNYLALFNGGKKFGLYYYEDMLAYCPINHFQNEPQNTDCYYRVTNMIQSMVQTMKTVRDNNIKGNTLDIVKNLMVNYNYKSSKIKDRTLLICKGSFGEKLKESDIAALYPYKYEICSKEKIEQVIQDKNTNFYYLQPAITLNKSIFVFDPSNGEVVYTAIAIMGLNFTKKDLETLSKTIQNP